MYFSVWKLFYFNFIVVGFGYNCCNVINIIFVIGIVNFVCKYFVIFYICIG